MVLKIKHRGDPKCSSGERIGFMKGPLHDGQDQTVVTWEKTGVNEQKKIQRSEGRNTRGKKELSIWKKKK